MELRTEFGLELWKELTDQLPQGSFHVRLSSIHWREAWKYGERAFRYCQHDIGHAWADSYFSFYAVMETPNPKHHI